MILTYGSGQEALSAHTLDGSLVNNQRIKVRFRTDDWQLLLDKELNLVKSGSHLPPVDGLDNSLLDDDVSVPPLVFQISGTWKRTI